MLCCLFYSKTYIFSNFSTGEIAERAKLYFILVFWQNFRLTFSVTSSKLFFFKTIGHMEKSLVDFFPFGSVIMHTKFQSISENELHRKGIYPSLNG